MSTRARRGSATTNADAAKTVDAGANKQTRRGKAAAASAAAADADALAPTDQLPPDAGAAGGHLSAYERERAALIARNRARMEALQLPALAADLAAAMAPPKKAAKPTQRGVKRARAPALELPPRTSLRSRGLAPDGGMVVHEGRNGRVVVAAASGAIGAVAAEAAEPEPRFAEGPLPFKSANGDDTSDAAFLASLRRCAGISAGDDAKAEAQAEAAAAAAALDASTAELLRLRLDPDDVRKCTRAGTTCVAWHPCSGTAPLIAASDKGGQVALWRVDAEGGGGNSSAADTGSTVVKGGSDANGGSSGGQAGDGDGDGDGDGGDDDDVFAFAAHSEYVSAMRWVGRGRQARLLSAAYDGSARLLDLEKGEFLLVPGLPLPADGAEWSAADAAEASGGELVYLASPEGDLTIVDTRSSAAVAAGLPLHDRKINTLALGPLCGGGGGGSFLASACSDGTVAVWDVRALSGGGGAGGGGKKPGKKPAPVSAVHHAKSSQGAAWARDGTARLLSVSFDDTLRVWAPAGGASSGSGSGSGGGVADFSGRMAPAAAAVYKHNAQTGRWVLPFRPQWWGGSAALVGSMKRGVDVYDASGAGLGGGGAGAAGRRVGTLEGEALTAIPSRLAPWEGDGRPMLAAATSSGRVHIFR